ncbi:MAG: hypothetical protein K5650_07700 [Bacteroidales bacterium]|nr:hypothetical protein [Bacteroidales bacterium]
MKHFGHTHTPVVKASVVLKDTLLPLLGVMGITFVLVAILFACLQLGSDMTPVIDPHHDDGELVDPNPLRLLFMAVALVAAFLCAVWADRKGRNGKLTAAFMTAYAGGTMLWQSMGECAWHFSIPNEDYIMCFPHIEGASAIFMVIITSILLAYCYRRHAFTWAVWVFVLSFIGNWFGHFVQIGTYPLVSELMEEGEWYALVGGILGSLTSLVALWMSAHVALTHKARLCCSLMLYFGLGIIATGVAGI